MNLRVGEASPGSLAHGPRRARAKARGHLERIEGGLRRNLRPTDTTSMLRVQLEGTPTTMGETFGEGFRHEIRELYALRRENALDQARRYGGRTAKEEDLLALAQRSLEATRAFDGDGYGELLGIAAGADLSPEAIMALNGLTDLRDGLAWGGQAERFGGCTGFVVQGDHAKDGQLRLGQTWDLGTENQPFVVAVHRRPRGAPETWAVTTVGCLSLMGMSETGLTLGTTNLRTTDARAGVPYLNLIHRALSCSHAHEAAEVIGGARRAGAHAFLIADGWGTALVLECTARRSEARWLRSGFEVQTNHAQAPVHIEIEADTPRASSEARLLRMRRLLAEGRPVDDEALQGFLGDRQGGSLAINRDDVDGISTNAAFVAVPSKRYFVACHGAPDRADWSRHGAGRGEARGEAPAPS